MKILLADAFEQSGVDALTEAGHDLDYQPTLTSPQLAAALGDAEVLVVRSTRVEADVFDVDGPLGLVIRAGAGTNTIDSKAAARRAVFVANVPGKNAVAVAELTMGLLLAIDRRIPDNVADARAGAWNKKAYSKAEGLLGKAIGIVGLGQIGLAVAERAAAFGMRVITTDKERDPETEERIKEIGIETVPGLHSLAEVSDVVSVHVPAGSSTKRMIDAEFLNRMRPGAVLINTSRGDVLDEDAVLAAIDDRGLRVGIDVFDAEPSEGTGPIESQLARHPAVYTTHHIGASTAQAQEAIAAEVVAMIRDYAKGIVRSVVNLTPPPPVGSVMVIRHYDRVGVLSAVLEELKRAGLNVQDMQNVIFAGAGAAVATIHVEGEIAESVRAGVSQNPDIIHITVRPALP
jgi:D-3-phosphoglycerate dehydrogenase / 2-oxoglutarate reductase